MAVGSEEGAIFFASFFLLIFSSLFILSVERSYGSQEEEAAEAVVLVSFVSLKLRPRCGAGWW